MRRLPALRVMSRLLRPPSLRRSAAGAHPPDYDAFISYSHALDGKIAQVLQREVERFARPWTRVRVLRIFRDTTSLSADPGLWSAIEQALGRSRWLLLMASPHAARSPWVHRELTWWLANRSAARIILLVTDGEIAWDDRTGDVDWPASTAVPPALRGAFAEQPRWVDLRWLRDAEQVDRTNPRLADGIADVAAAVRGLPKDTLVGEHIREERTVKRVRRAVTAALAVLLFVAVLQTREALDQARTATGRGMAATAVAALSTRADQGQLLATEAFRMDRSPQTRSALFQAVAADPYLVAQTPTGGRVTALAGSADGRVAVAGTTGGRLIRWDVSGRTTTTVTAGNRPITSVAVSADGGRVVAADGGAVVLWDAGRAPRRIPLAGPDLVAVSPSGRLAAAGATGRAGFTLLDGRSGAVLRHGWTGLDLSVIGLPDDATVTLASATGRWRWLSAETLAITGGSDEFRTPAGGYVFGFAPGMEYAGFMKYRSVTVWPMRRPTAAGSDGTLSATLPVTQPELLAVSRDGTRAAASGGDVLYVDDLSTEAGSVPQPRRLSGHGRVGALTFLGAGDRIVAAADGMLAMWDLTRPSALARPPFVDMPEVSQAGPPPNIAVTRDGTRVAVISDGGFTTPGVPAGSVVHDLRGPVPKITRLASTYTYELPIWSADGSRLLVTGPGGATDVVEEGRTVQRWPGLNTRPVVAGRVSRDGSRVAFVDDHAGVLVRSMADGRVLRTVPGTTSPLTTPGSQTNGVAAVSEDLGTVAYARFDERWEGPVTVADVATGRTRPVPGSPAMAVSFSGDRLLVQRRDGTLETWDTAGPTMIHASAGDTGYSRALAALPALGLVARLRDNGTVTVADLDSGDELGSFALPPMTRGSVPSPWFATVLIGAGDAGELVSATSGGPLVRWRMTEDAWLDTACATAGRDLTPGEWRAAAGTDPPDDLTCAREP
ncbi:TIR domain-containing protein [Sphaerisporangium corydalis]|uniref:TIR domain-containing protein n=1 Tax=Sphaerisporangium corydalis TaxID=1441875 RepID=A0ABV9EL07_9ACTN|nr:TIR domain-containing protein [Sphaerisporangium corydalis]